MHCSPLLPVALLAGALVLGCDQQSVPVEPASSPQPSLRTGQSPEGPGAQVIRFGFDFFGAGPDTALGVPLAFTVGLVSPLADFPFPPELGCGGTGPVISDGKRAIQLVFAPGDKFHELIRVRQATIVLYETSSPDICDWATAPVFGRGRANITQITLSRTPSTLVRGFKLQGIVELTSGGRARIWNTFQGHLDEDGTVRVHVDHFGLKPIGR
jgi:hypothetical protein